MSIDINELLSLPQRERRKIAEKLFTSLSPNNSVEKLSKEEEEILRSRWNKYIAGKMKFYSSKEMTRKVFGTK
jgi:putative addiction module component (TIGR02574 family)